MSNGQPTSPIEAAVDNYCRAIEAGSGIARDQLAGMVRGAIDTYDMTWMQLLGNATNEWINTTATGDPLSLGKEFSAALKTTRRLRWQLFKTRFGGNDAVLRDLLRECLDRFGDRYLCHLARKLATAMKGLDVK